MDPEMMNETSTNTGARRQADGGARDEPARPVGPGSFGCFALSAPFGPRIVMAPEGVGSLAGEGAGDGGASGGDGEKPGEGGDGGEDAGDKGSDGGDGAAAKPERPDYIPEDFWDAEKGFRKDRLDSLLAVQAELDAKKAQIPEAPDKYELKLPATFKPPEGVELAEGESLVNPDDPRVAAAREFAHKSGMNQADFEALMQFGVEQDLAEQTRLKEGLAEQKEKLGARSTERIRAVTQWLGAKLGGDLAESLHGMLYTAAQVEAFEALMRLNRGDVPGSPGAGRDGKPGTPSDEEWAKMSPTDRIIWSREHAQKRK